MQKFLKAKYRSILVICLVFAVASTCLLPKQANADSGSASAAIGIQGIIPSPPPSEGATITVPVSGNTFTSLPITISGICPSGLLVKVFSNNILIGSVECSNGSYSLQADLFSGQNNLTALDYDSLNQSGPVTPTVTVTYNNAQFQSHGIQLTLTSNYAEIGAAPGSQLVWPITVNGGIGPYAISVDWGDGSAPELLSETANGTINIEHTYQVSGVYKVLVRATDKDGDTAFLQLVGQATGAITSNSTKSTNSTPIIEKEWVIWPVLLLIPFIFISFWDGRHYQMKYMKMQQEKYEEVEAEQDKLANSQQK